jgi:hypothetical protein
MGAGGEEHWNGERETGNRGRTAGRQRLQVRILPGGRRPSIWFSLGSSEIPEPKFKIYVH